MPDRPEHSNVFDPAYAHTMSQAEGADAQPSIEPRISSASSSLGGFPKFEKYIVEAELGEGGMGRVYKAFDPILKRHVAIKVLKSGTDVFEINRFRAEAEMVATLDHVNIVKVHDVGNGTNPYIVLEYLDGGTLGDRLRKALPKPREAAEWMITLAEAVHEAHRKGIIHRDLKPGNVLQSKSGLLKVTDFGLGKRLQGSDSTGAPHPESIASIRTGNPVSVGSAASTDNSSQYNGQTRHGDIFGTPAYMAPEQASGNNKAVGPHTDVYALGAILYEMLTGRPPFAGARNWEILYEVQYTDPQSPTLLQPRLPRDLSTICLKCLEKAPKARYATAQELADDLHRYLNNEPIVARPAPWYESILRRIQRRPVQSAVIAAFILGTLIIVALGFYLFKQSSDSKLRDAQVQERIALQNQQTERDAAYKETITNQFKHSMKALGEIRKLTMQGELDEANQKKLRTALVEYYTNLGDRNAIEANVSPLDVATETITLGELIRQTDDKNRGIEVYVKALKLLETVQPATTQSDKLRLNAMLALGQLHRDLANYDEATIQLAAADSLLKHLEGNDPSAYQPSRGELQHKYGELYSRQGELEKARDAFTLSINLRKRIYDRTPNQISAITDLARGYGYRGDAFLDLGQAQGADRDYWTSHRLRETALLEANKGTDAQLIRDLEYQLARSWNNLAEFQTRYRAFEAAQFFHEQAEKLRIKLVEKNGSRTEYRSDLVYGLNRRIELYLLSGDTDSLALAGIKLGLADQEIQIILARSPDEIESQAMKLYQRSLLARYELLQNKTDDATKTAREALKSLSTANLMNPTKLRGIDCYCLAAACAILAQTNTGKLSIERDQAMKWFTLAMEKRYRDKHPDDIRRDCAFKELHTEREFDNALKQFDDAAKR